MTFQALIKQKNELKNIAVRFFTKHISIVILSYKHLQLFKAYLFAILSALITA